MTPADFAGYMQFGFTALAILGVLVIAHEFGHFIVARMVGVPVEKFSVGFGRKIYGKKVGETEYMVCLVPLGGYVKFYGDDPDEEKKEPKAHEGYSFFTEPVWKRLAIVAAGPIFNLILAVFIYAVAAMIGWPEMPDINAGQTMPAVMEEVLPNEPAHKAGIRPGDTVVAVNGIATPNWESFREHIVKSPNVAVTLSVVRPDGGKEDIIVTPKEEKRTDLDGTVKSVGLIGVAPKGLVVSYPPHIALVKGVEKTVYMTGLTVWVIGKLITRDIPANQITGPIGIMQIGGQAAERGVVYLLMLVGFISVNLAVVNLMPIPVLDGGHIFFFSIEAIIGKPLSMRHQEIAQHIGLIMILSLMVLAFYNDFVRIFAG